MTIHNGTAAPLFPVFLKLAGQDCLVVGGGQVAWRKIEALRQCGARIRIVAPTLKPACAEFVASGACGWRQGEFTESDVGAALLIVAATSKASVNARVAAAADRAHRLVNVVDDPETSRCFVPATLHRGPLTVAYGTGGCAPTIARKMRETLARALPGGLEALAEAAGRLRPEVQACLPPKQRRHFWDRVLEEAWQAPPRSVSHWMQHWRQQLTPEFGLSVGIVHIVGAGPGDPDLLTIRALRCMERADVVLYDRLVTPEILSRVRLDAERIYVGKSRGCCALTQEEINQRLVKEARAGRRVLRLKGGDPFLFGRGGEEVEVLEAAGIRYEVVPGITAALGCAADAGIPLTHRRLAHACLLLTAHGRDELAAIDWRAAARAGQTVVIYMGLRELPTIRDRLLAHGLSGMTPAALVERGTTSEQRVLVAPLATLPEYVVANAAISPALLVIGGVVGLSPAWRARTVADPATDDGPRPEQSMDPGRLAHAV